MKLNRLMKATLLALVLTIGLGSQVFAQDSLRVMCYNILRYGAQGIGGCTPTGVSARNPFFTPIMEATRPDIFGVNEVGPFNTANSPAANILINILQPINSAYKRADVTFNNSQDIANAMFYNSNKVELDYQAVVPQSFRNLDYYKFYYKGPGLALGDTTFIEVVLVHFAASASNTRLAQAQAIMSYLDNFNRAGNFIVMGDMNLNSANSAPFQAMVAHSNSATKMNDPISLGGTWGNNVNADHAWSQSTRNSSGSDCGSGGGLDDRFDIILCSNSIMNNSQLVNYRTGSYWVPGNPNAPNRGLPAAAAGSIPALSDHHPVMVTLDIDRAVAAEAPLPQANLLEVLGQPVNGQLHLRLGGESGLAGSWSLDLLDLQGRVLQSESLQGVAAGHRKQFATDNLAAGIYLVRLAQEGNPGIIKKVLVH